MWSSEVSTDNNISDTEETIMAVVTVKSSFRTIAFVCSVIMILCCACGAFGNIMSLIIFTRPSMRRLSVNVLLTGLSLVDLTLVVLAVPTFAVNGLNDYFLDLTLYENLYSAVLFALYPLSMMAQTCSIWTFVLISIERYYAVCRPLIVKRLLTVKRARLAQFGIFLLAISYNCIRFFEYGEPSDPDKEFDRRYLRKNKFYFTFYYTSLYLLTHFLIPFVVITTLNIHILRRLRRAQVERERLSHAQQEQCRTTRMIIVVTVMFGLCNCLSFVINLWEVFDFRLFDETPTVEWTLQGVDLQDLIEYFPNKTEHDYTGPADDDNASTNTSIAYLLLDISNTLVAANAAGPFVICLLYCKRYRRLFWKYCTCLCCRFRKSNVDQPSNWSSYALRQYSTTMESFTAVATNDFRSVTRKKSSSSTGRLGRLREAKPRSPRKRERHWELEQSNNEHVRMVSYVNGLVILDKEVISRSAEEMRKGLTEDV